MPYKPLLYNLKGITPEEFVFLEKLLESFSEQEAQQFIVFYSGKRHSPSDILLFTLLGLLGVSGVQRFVLGQIGMGLLYFFTGGLCLIGTIVDAVNHKGLALEHNQQVAYDCARMIKRVV